VLQYDGALIGQGGRLDLAVLPTATSVNAEGTVANVVPGSDLRPGTTVVMAPNGDAPSSTGSTVPTAVLNVIGGGGLSPAALDNLKTQRGFNLTEATPVGALVRDLRSRET
jgi:hypothetical protein